MTDMINVEVVYGLPDKQRLLSLSVAADCTIKEAIIQSGIVGFFPEIDVENATVGIFSRTAKLSDCLREGDRVEIYRPLLADPKEIRKRRAAQAKAKTEAIK